MPNKLHFVAGSQTEASYDDVVELRRSTSGDMNSDCIGAFESSLVGRTCTVERREHDWAFDLLEGFGLAVSVPWRIVTNGRIALGSSDDGHKFGLPAQVDGQAVARELIGVQTITGATLDRLTADLTLIFSEGARIDVFNNSAGYEGWQAGYVVQGKQRTIIALGGGEVAFF